MVLVEVAGMALVVVCSVVVLILTVSVCKSTYRLLGFVCLRRIRKIALEETDFRQI